MFQRYGYNIETRRCELFIYGGCHGNANRFQTMASCIERCDNEQSTSQKNPRHETTEASEYPTTAEDICTMPMVTGPCRANMQMYGYYPVEGTCKMFTYGGCGGNHNTFRTYESCMMRCNSSASNTSSTKQYMESTTSPFDRRPDICNFSIEQGPCYAEILMYAYDSKFGDCMEFTYGGCLGNENKFESYSKCRNMCIRGQAMTEAHTTSHISHSQGRSVEVCSRPHVEGNK